MAAPDHRLRGFEAAGIHHRDTENTEKQKTASLLFILDKLERTLGLPFFRSFAGLVNFVGSLGEDLGAAFSSPDSW
jgi:hypothetical protein